MPDPEYANWSVPPDRPSNYTVSGGTVMDNVTKLMWQQGISPTNLTWENARTYCRDLSLNGHTDWRLPTRIELISIADDGAHNPAIRTATFSGTPSVPFWSASTHVANSSQAWVLNYYYGDAEIHGKGSSHRVRCVRYGPGYPTRQALGTTRYAGSGTVIDNWTGISWQQNPDGWQWGDYFNVQGTCSGIWGWTRLPRRKELETIVDVRRQNPAWSSVFQGPMYGSLDYFWTSTNDGPTSEKKLIEFRYGESDAAGTGYDIPTGRCIK